MASTPISPKVTTAALAGAVTLIVVWAVGFTGVDVPAEVSSAFTVLLMGAAAYLKRDPMRDEHEARHAE